MVLQGSDLGTGHAVATCGKWLFDSNLKKAQMISAEVFDWCVSSKHDKCKFVRIHWAMRLLPLPKPFTFKGNNTDSITPFSNFFDALGFTKISDVLHACYREEDWRKIFTKIKFFSKHFQIRKIHELLTYTMKYGDYLYILMEVDDKGKPFNQQLLYGHWMFMKNEDTPKYVDFSLLKQFEYDVIYQIVPTPKFQEVFSSGTSNLFKLDKVFGYGITHT